MSELKIEAIASDIAAETGCSEYVAQMAVRTRVGVLIRSDAPALPDGVGGIVPQAGPSPLAAAEHAHRLGRSAQAAAELAAMSGMSFGDAMSAMHRAIAAGGGLATAEIRKPPQPQSFERPKRRILLE